MVVHAATVGDADWLPAATRSHGAAAIYGPPDVGFPEDGVIAIGKPDAAGWVHGEVAPEALRRCGPKVPPCFSRWDEQQPRIAQVEAVPLPAASPDAT